MGLVVQCDEGSVRTSMAAVKSRGRWFECVARVGTVS